MLNTSDVKSLGKGGTTVSLEGISDKLIYANTSEIVDANLTLTSSSTLTDLVNGMSAEKTKVIRVNNDNAAYTQVRRILDNPETGGPPSSLCCFYFKFVSTDLIQAYYGYSSNYLSVSIIAKFPASGWGFTSWRALNAGNFATQLHSAGPSSTAITVSRSDENSFPSMLFSLNGNFAESYRQGIVISNSSQGNTGIMIGKDNMAYVDYSGTYIYLREDNVKTINNTSIYGSGNIDTTPTLKTINSQSITGDGNINTLKVYHGNEWNPEIDSDFDGGVWVGYRTLSSGQDPTGTGTTSVNINAFKFGDGRGSGGYSDVYCKKLYTSSDERLKENIKPYEPTTSVLDLSIKEFNYKDSKVKSVGVIAQEVQKLFPDVVNEDKKSGYLSVDDRSLMYMLMAEVKKLRDRINELEGK